MDRKRIGTFLLGGLAGVLTGILVAPRSGRELRGSLANRAGEARERGRETVFDARERVAERISERSTRPAPFRGPAEPTLGVPEPFPAGAPVETPPVGEEGRPHLRDVSIDAVPQPEDARPEDMPSGEEERAEDLRRRVRETRERLRARLRGPEGP